MSKFEECGEYFRVEMPEYKTGDMWKGERIHEAFNIWMENGYWIIQHCVNHTTFLEV